VEASDAKSLSRKMSWQRAAPSDFWLRDRFLAPKSRNYLLQFAVHGVSGRFEFRYPEYRLGPSHTVPCRSIAGSIAAAAIGLDPATRRMTVTG
jgi:hypothetical protein